MHFLFIDDAIDPPGDAQRYRALLSSGEFRVTAVAPNRETLLVPELQIQPNDIDGFILDINLRDHVQAGRERFIGTGAGIAQDIRLLQSIGGTEGQRPRPIVRLCAAQVFQQYIKGDNSTASIFDLGFDKETIADVVGDARAQMMALPDIYRGISDIAGDVAQAAVVLGLSRADYLNLHSVFRQAYEYELGRKVHEAASFFLTSLLLSPGLLIGEELLAVRLGVDRLRSPGWVELRDLFVEAKYVGRGATGFERWWVEKILVKWAEFSSTPLFRLTSAERVALLRARGNDIQPLAATPFNPGDRPWAISDSHEDALRLPTDPNFSYALSILKRPWQDQTVWCLEQAKRQRGSILLSDSIKARLLLDLTAQAQRNA